MSQFFETLIFNQDIWGNVHYVPEINLVLLGNPDESLLAHEKKNI